MPSARAHTPAPTRSHSVAPSPARRDLAAQWEEVVKLLGPPIGEPVVATPGASISPFGSTQIFGYDGLVFQVRCTPSRRRL